MEAFKENTMKEQPTTLREASDGAQALIGETMEQLKTLAYGKYHEGSRVIVTQDQAEIARLRMRFNAEVKHWQKQRDYWRGLLDKFPHLADRDCAEAITAKWSRAAGTVANVPAKPAPLDDANLPF